MAETYGENPEVFDPRKAKIKQWTRRAMYTSLAAHVIFGIVAAFIVALTVKEKEETVFETPP